MAFLIIMLLIATVSMIYFADKFAKWLNRRNYEEKRKIYRSYMVDKLMDDAEAMETFRQMCEEAERTGWK